MSLGQTIKPRGSGSGLVSSRFLVRTSGGDAEHNTLGYSIGDDNHPIKWDLLAEWDDIGGFSTDPSTSGGFFFVAAGDYLITASAELAATTAFTTGTMLLSIETGVSLVNTEVTTQIAPFETDPELSCSTVHHFTDSGFDSFEVHVKTFNVDDTSAIAKASVTITKLS